MSLIGRWKSYQQEIGPPQICHWRCLLDGEYKEFWCCDDGSDIQLAQIRCAHWFCSTYISIGFDLPAGSLSALLCKSVSSAVISTKDDCSDDLKAESKQLLGNLEERWSRCGESNDLLTASKAPLTALASFVCGNDNPRVHTQFHLHTPALHPI